MCSFDLLFVRLCVLCILLLFFLFRRLPFYDCLLNVGQHKECEKEGKLEMLVKVLSKTLMMIFEYEIAVMTFRENQLENSVSSIDLELIFARKSVSSNVV